MSTHLHGTLPWDSPPEPPPTWWSRTKPCRYCKSPIPNRRTVCGPCRPLYIKHLTKARKQTARLIELAHTRKDT